MSKARILVVDDEPKIVNLLKRKLEEHHYDVVTASDGAEALRQVQRQKLDLILLDAIMPLMNGFEVLSRLKADRHTGGIPVVMVTAKTDTNSIFRSQELLARDYLTKPLDFDLLLSTVKRCVKLASASDETPEA